MSLRGAFFCKPAPFQHGNIELLMYLKPRLLRSQGRLKAFLSYLLSIEKDTQIKLKNKNKSYFIMIDLGVCFNYA